MEKIRRVVEKKYIASLDSEQQGGLRHILSLNHHATQWNRCSSLIWLTERNKYCLCFWILEFFVNTVILVRLPHIVVGWWVRASVTHIVDCYKFLCAVLVWLPHIAVGWWVGTSVTHVVEYWYRLSTPEHYIPH